jgi:hypothetical protein
MDAAAVGGPVPAPRELSAFPRLTRAPCHRREAGHRRACRVEELSTCHASLNNRPSAVLAIASGEARVRPLSVTSGTRKADHGAWTLCRWGGPRALAANIAVCARPPWGLRPRPQARLVAFGTADRRPSSPSGVSRAPSWTAARARAAGQRRLWTNGFTGVRATDMMPGTSSPHRSDDGA